MSTVYPDLPFTKFPEALDEFQGRLDMTADDGDKVKLYREAMERGDYQGAYAILSQIPSAERKILKAEDLNRLGQAIQALERFYGTDIYDYIQYKEKEWRNALDQFAYEGTWKGQTAYQENNLVAYPDLESKMVYIAIRNVPANVAPTDVTYWRPMTIKGEQGNSGPGVTYKGNWYVGNAYKTSEVVTYDGALWGAVRNTTGQTPGQSPAWRLLVSFETTTYPIQSTPPTNQKAGGLWFNTSEVSTEYYHLEPLSNPAVASDIAQGKTAYNDKGEKIIGTGTGGGGRVQWNGPSSLKWNGASK